MDIHNEPNRLCAILDGFLAASPVSPASPALFEKLLNGFGVGLSQWQKSEEETASDFDILDTLNISEDELRHSRMLAWLLDSRIDHFGTHGQGNLGFRLFLSGLGFDESYAQGQYWVTRESRNNESIVDIEIAATRCFIIHIENKIYSKEGNEQTPREWRDLCKRAKQLNVQEDRAHGVFLTLEGNPPSCDKFRAVSWTKIAAILDEFAELAKAPEVKMFARHYARALRRMIQPQIGN